MRVMLLHGYGLLGSGSNLYTNRLSAFLHASGTAVHVMCQAHDHEIPEHFSRRISYSASGEVMEDEFLPGRPKDGATLHRPHVGPVLPVYNWDIYPGFSDVRSFTELSENELEAYLVFHAKALRRAVRDHGIDVIHVNHVLAMPEAALRVCKDTGCRLLLTPHGSAIEYVAKRQERYRVMAMRGLRECDEVVLGGTEMLDRIESDFSTELGVREKSVVIPTGVDTDTFRPRRGEPRAPSLCSHPEGASRGLMDELYDAVCAVEVPELIKQVEQVRLQYNHRVADRDVEDELAVVPWGRAPVVAFAGKLVAGKGVHVLLAAAVRCPDVQILIVGEGSFREPLELLVRALGRSNLGLYKRVLRLSVECPAG